MDGLCMDSASSVNMAMRSLEDALESAKVELQSDDKFEGASIQRGGGGSVFCGVQSGRCVGCNRVRPALRACQGSCFAWVTQDIAWLMDLSVTGGYGAFHGMM